MYFLTICLFAPIINALIVTQIHRNSIFRSHSSCIFISNISFWSNDISIQSCIWECVYEYYCQTAIYFKDEKVCSMYSDLCENGSIESSGNVRASVICYRKNHNPIITCSSTIATTTTISDLGSFWSFDNNTLDSLSNFNGTPVNNPTYKTPGINGYGSALSVNRGYNQYVNVPTYRNLTYRSFTVEMWFYCIDLTSSDEGLFGQCHAPTTDECLYYQIENHQLELGFYSDDLYGLTNIRTNIWYHVAFVYNYSSSTQYIYLNGILDGNRTAASYQGTSGSIVIGKTEQNPAGNPNYFSGYIDEVLLTMRAKNATEILDDATLVCWCSFDNDSYADSGPLHLKGTAVNITFINGKIHQAISFTSNSSYYQIGGFVLLGISNYSYSIALWVCPASMSGSTLVHLSTETNGQGWCVDLIGFSSTGQIIITGWVGNSYEEVVGPILPDNVWTHVVNTFSTTNGYRLYVNGTLINGTNVRIYLASTDVNILTLGNPLQGIQASAGGTCNSQSIVPQVFSGSIDEFRVYSRELNSADIEILVNL